MKILRLFLAFLALAAPAALLAFDARVRSVLFKPDTVVRFVGKPGYQSAIRFGPDEQIENVAVGDSVAWQVTPNKRGDRLFVKPLVAGARSNMTVVTDMRTYLFDLEATRTAQPIYVLGFQYPAWPAPGAVQPLPPPAPAAVTPVMEAAAAQQAPPKLHFGWVSRGAKELLPARAFDDGQSVYLTWPEESPLPAILVAASDGAEGPVNYRMEAGHIVVDGVPPQLILRRGKARAILSATRTPAAPIGIAKGEAGSESR
jgi:type IV secretion system protein VirB9